MRTVRKRTKKRGGTVTLPTFNGKLSIRAKDGMPIARMKTRELNGTILRETTRALSHQGIPRNTVFTTKGVSSYSVYPADPTKVVRESAGGKRTVGRIVDGHFRPQRSE